MLRPLSRSLFDGGCDLFGDLGELRGEGRRRVRLALVELEADHVFGRRFQALLGGHVVSPRREGAAVAEATLAEEGVDAVAIALGAGLGRGDVTR